MEVNYFSQIALTKGLFEMMKASISPSSVVMSSLSGLFGFPLRSAYCASKHALHGFYETLQLETIQTNTHTMLVCPGRIKTDISFSALDGEGNAYNKQSLGQLKGLDVSVCADKIIKGIKNKNKILLITKEEIILYYIKKIIPSLFYKIASKIKND
jgi:short-subunit dehydrogenase